MRKVHYWCTGQWCEAEELDSMLVWMRDDYGTLEVHDSWSDEMVDKKVHDLVG